jgi:hypothetical protein
MKLDEAPVWNKQLTRVRRRGPMTASFFRITAIGVS